jgi:hypothetical protein
MTKTKLSKKTVDLLRKLEAYILEEPKRFNLTLWGEIVDPKIFKDKEQLRELENSSYYEATVVEQKPPCGAVGCIAGNLCILSGIIKPKQIIKNFDSDIEVYEFSRNTPKQAAEALGLSYLEAAKLFFLKYWEAEYNDETGEYIGWPDEFAKRLEAIKPGTKAYAKVTVARIEHFIETGE